MIQGSDHLGLLARSLARVPIPTTEPSRSQSDQEFGLHLLSTAVRLEHIQRISETIKLVDSTHMSRSVALDLDLNSLNDSSRRALNAHRTTSEAEHKNLLWLPLERHSRHSLSPLTVRDASGEILPLMTGLETSRVLAAGLSYLFYLLLHSNSEYQQRGTPQFDSQNEQVRSSWLIVEAIKSLVEVGPDFPLSAAVGSRANADLSRPTEIRRVATRVAESVAPKGSPLDALLELAATEYIVVARIAPNDGVAHLEYQAPLIPARARSRLGSVLATAWLPILSSEFSLVYETAIPSGVDSYHVTLEVPQEIEIRRMILSSDADHTRLVHIQNDLEALADDIEDAGSAPNKVQELELQSVVSRLADMTDSRLTDLQEYRRYVKRRYGTLQGPGPWLPSLPIPRRKEERSTNAGPFGPFSRRTPLIANLAQLRNDHHEGSLLNLAENSEPRDLRALRRRIGDQELGFDVYVDNDPRENGAHAQWRRKRSIATGTNDPTIVRVSATMADDTPSLSASVARLLLALLALVMGIRALLGDITFTPGTWMPWALLGADPQSDDTSAAPISTADALVAVLLLVPGVLVTRLDFPSHRTVLGRLRLLPRYQAYAGVIVTCTLGLVVATQPEESLPDWLYLGSLLLTVLLLASLLDGGIRAWRRRVFTPRLQDIPTWLRDVTRRFPTYARRNVTARFSTRETGQ